MKKDFEKLFLQVYGPFLQEHGFVKKKLKGIQWSQYVTYFSYDEQAGLLRMIKWKILLAGDTGLYDIELAVSSLSTYDNERPYFNPYPTPCYQNFNVRIFNSHKLKQVNQRQNDLAFHYFRDNPELTILGLQVTFEIAMEYKQFILANSISQYFDESMLFCSKGFNISDDVAFNDAIMMNNITEAIQINDYTISNLKEDIESRQRDIMDPRYKRVEEVYLKIIEDCQNEIFEITQIKEQLLRGEYSHFQEKVQQSHALCLKWIDEVLKPKK